jgi:hypothetical protein
MLHFPNDIPRIAKHSRGEASVKAALRTPLSRSESLDTAL